MERKSSTEYLVVFLGKVFSVHNYGFCGDLNTFFIELSRSTSLEFAAFGNGSDIKHGRASAFRYFLSTTMVFAHFPKKNTRVYVNPAAIDPQDFFF